MLGFADVEQTIMPLSLQGTVKPLTIALKCYARKDEEFSLDTAIAPGAAGNDKYWNVAFNMAI